MNKIQLSLKNFNGSIEKIEIINIEIKESEGKPPTAFIAIPLYYKEQIFSLNNSTLDTLNSVIHGKIVDKNATLFSGIVSDISILPDRLTILLSTQISNESPLVEEITTDPDILKLLYNNNLEIPEIFGKLKVPFYDKKDSQKSIISIVDDNNIVNFDDKIIKDSLKIQSSQENTFSQIELTISAIWTAKIDGDIDISSKISHKFTNNQINTLTPRKFEMSWPRCGDKISGPQSNRASRYSFGISRITPANTLHISPTDLSNINVSIQDCPPIKLKRHWYNHKLSICFCYDQLKKEIINVTINNPNCPNGITKKITINLGNVQEFLPNDTINNFFETDIGQKTYEYLTSMAGNYIASSMRDTTISFSIPYTPDISCKTWISVAGYIAKITNLKINNRVIEVEAQAFSNEKCRQLFKKSHTLVIPSKLTFETTPPITSEDIIHDIVVSNDSFAQTEALLNFVRKMKTSQQINKLNYKQLINRFLNTIPTLITIVTKPLKTERCQYIIHNADYIHLPLV